MNIRIAIVGVGNCAKSLVEGIASYRRHPETTVGLRRPLIGPYAVHQIDVVAAFDIDRRKVAKPLEQALVSAPNRTKTLGQLSLTRVTVMRGPTLDSVIPQARQFYIQESDHAPVDVAAVLKAAGTQIVVNYLPTGSNTASRAYAEAALEAGCSFINCMPTPLAKDGELRNRFAAAGQVLLGDDIKSQCGATVLNRVLLELFQLRGVYLIDSTQVNYGGNADHFNLSFRPQDKEECKKSALQTVAGSSGVKPQVRMVYKEDLYDHKRAEIKIRGQIFGGASVNVDVLLEDEDSPNSSGIVVDAIRAAKILRDCGKAEKAVELCATLMKNPPAQYEEVEAAEVFDRTIDEVLTISGLGAAKSIMI
jgi:myo-inositol-1-phosphate synthase